MLDGKTIVTVVNRNNGTTGYSIPEMGGLTRIFASGESKQVEFEELRKLSYQPGGDYIIQNYLVIFNAEAVAELIGDVEPEYYYTEKDVEDLLVNGSLDALDDCLTFAPDGVIEMVKSISVTIKLNDMLKRELIFDKTGFNVDNAIKNNKYAEQIETKEVKKERKTNKPVTSVPTEPQRKTAIPKYNVVTPKK